MADDPQMPPDPQVFGQDWTNIRINLENLSKVAESENLEIANKVEKNTHKEEDTRPVKPWAQLRNAGNRVTEPDNA